MAFIKGKSGNPNGKPKQCQSYLKRLYERFREEGEEIIDSVIRDAKKGKPVAQTLCMERLIPKIKKHNLDYTIPEKITEEAYNSLRLKLIQAVLDGKMDATDAKIVTELMNEKSTDMQKIEVDINLITKDNAEETYKKVMSKS